MSTVCKFFVVAGLAVVLLTPAVAQEKQQSGCVQQGSVNVKKMGIVNEEALQAHIAKVQDQMKKVQSVRGAQFAQKLELKRHVTEMQTALQELYNQLYSGGCEEAMRGASVETRVEVIEKQVKVMQQLLEQLVQHLSEQER